MTIIGSASIQIRADDKYFEPDVRRAVAKIKNVSIVLKADADLAKATKKIRDLRYRITSKDAVLKVDANMAKAEAKMARLLAKFLNKDLNFNAVANTQGANTALSTLRDRYKNTRIPFTAQADTAAARAALTYASRNRTSTISARIDPATMAAVTGLFNTLTGTLPMEKIKGALTGVAANFESMATMATVLTAALGVVSAAVLTTGANILSIGKDITEVVGITALFPTALFGLVTVLKANKMAWQDFGTAATDNSKKANEALAKLPPEAQEAAKALRGVKEEIQKPVQKAFWEAAGTSLQDMVRKQLPTVITGLSGVSSAMGGFSKEVFDTVKGIGDLGESFSNVETSIRNMVPGIAPAITALNTFVNTGSEYLPRFGEWMSELGNKFGEFTRKAQESGQINVWIETGIQRLQEMGSIVKSTTQFFGGLAEAAKLAGAPGLTEMAAGMRNIADIVNGEPFQSRLVAVLEGARVGTDALAQGFSDLTEFIGESSTSIGIFLAKAGAVGGTALSSIRSLFDGTGLGTGIFNALSGLDKALQIMQPGFADLGDSLGHLGDIAEELFVNMAPGLNQLFETIEGVLAGLKDGIIEAMPIFNEFVQAILTLVQGPVIFLAEQIGNVLEAFADLPGVVQTVIMSLGLFLLLKNKFIGFFDGIGKSLNNEKTGIGQAYTGIRDGANTTKNGVSRAFSDLGANIRNALAVSAEAGSKAFSPIIGRAEDAAERTKAAFSGVGTAFKQGMNISSEFDTVRNGFQNLSTSVTQTARGMGDTLKGVGSDIAKAIIPAGVRESASRFHNDLAPAREAFSNLVPAAADAGERAGRALGSGVARASSGLMGALGGPWGIALAGATVALGIFAAEQAKTAAQVDSLAASLEAQAGAFSDGSRKIVARDLLDLDATAMDDFFRGISNQGRNAEEIIDALGVSSKTVVATLSDRTARTKYMEDWEKIGKASHGTRADFDKLAGAVGTTGKALEDLKPQEIYEMAKRVKEAGNLAAEAEKKYEAMAKATGTSTIQAAALSANYDILNSATSSVSAKFGAFKSNLDILNGGLETTRNATRDNAEEMLNFGDKIVGIAEKNGGLIEGTKTLSQAFKDSLLNIDGTFSSASQGAIDFSRQMEASRDTILQIGMAEMQKLRDAGKELPEAQAGALKAMEGPLATFRQKLTDLGIDGTMVNQIMGQLGLDPEKLRGALVVDTGDAEAKIARASLMAAAFASGNYEVAFTALTDEAKQEILKVTEYADAYKNGGWKAVMEIIDKTGDKVPEFLLGMKEAKNLEDIKKVIDVENPGAKKIAEATAAVDEYGKKVILPKGLEAIDGVTPITEQAKAGIEAYAVMPEPTKNLNATDNTAGAVLSAMGSMGGLPDVTRFLFATDGTADGKSAAQGTMNGLMDVTRSLFGNNAAGVGVGLAQGTMNTLFDVTRSLFANNKTQDGKNAAQGTIDSTKDKTANIYAADKTYDGVNSAKLSIGSVIGKTVDVITNFITNGRNEDGGIWKGGERAFADGGILSRVKTPAVKAYAGGGIENHTAQIAKGAWPVRIWAEPETGGEAYIPLGMNKRKRSLEILRQVMAEFGLSSFAQFADGGVVSGTRYATPNVVSSRYSSSPSVISQTVAQSAGPASVVNFTVNPSQGLSEEQIGEAAMRELYWQIASR